MQVDRDELLNLMKAKLYKPKTLDELVESLGGDNRSAWIKTIRDLEAEGAIFRNDYGRYGLMERMGLASGRLSVQKGKYGFVIQPEHVEDIYVGAASMHGAMHNDTVVVRMTAPSRDGRRGEGEVVRILRRANEVVVGRVKHEGEVAYCVPDERAIAYDILLNPSQTSAVHDGDRVVVRITRWPEERRGPEGVLDRVLGPAEDRKLDSLAVIYAFGLPIEFPAEVEAEAQSFGTDPRSEDIAGRRDLRGWTTFTIDGADAKDFDDAVSLNRLDNGNWQLGVHIADVSHYVRARSALDEEALSRATSVYLLDRVVPMLPEALSNGLCSLRPDVDRLTMSAIMEIAPDGRQVQAEIVESVIHSHNRFTYDEVNAVLEGDPEARARFTQYVPILEDMNSLAQTLTRVRMERGMIEFEQSESDITLDDTGEVIDVQPGTRTAADNLIEQFMLQANETVAERYYWQEVPFIYRVHEEPDPDRVESLNNLLGRFGLQVRAGRQKMHPRVFQAVLLEVEGHPQEPLISRVMLRTMRRARYSPECLGHFGLAARYYCHFTSPIRRYPDLAIHRIIKETLHGTLSEKRVESLKFFVARAADISSEREQLATEAERELDSIKKVQFMAKHVGEEFDGIISGVTSFGFFVELPSTIEGLVHVSSLTDDYYQFIERDFALLGQAAHRRFQLGDSVRILVSRVDEMEGLVDFELVGLQEQQPGESYVQDPTEVSVHRPAKHHEKRAGKKAEVRKERRFAR